MTSEITTYKINLVKNDGKKTRSKSIIEVNKKKLEPRERERGW